MLGRFTRAELARIKKLTGIQDAPEDVLLYYFAKAYLNKTLND